MDPKDKNKPPTDSTEPVAERYRASDALQELRNQGARAIDAFPSAVEEMRKKYPDVRDRLRSMDLGAQLRSMAPAALAANDPHRVLALDDDDFAQVLGFGRPPAYVQAMSESRKAQTACGCATASCAPPSPSAAGQKA